MENDQEMTIDLGRILYLLWHNVVAIAAVTLAGALIGFCYAQFFITPMYSANADMLVNNTQKDLNNLTITNADISASSNLVDTYSIIIKSHMLLGEVVAELGLDYSYNKMTQIVSVESVDDTQVMRITVRDPDPEVAMQIVECIVDLAPDAIMETVAAGSVRVVDDPWTTGRPISPNKQRYTAVVALAGFMACAGVIILKDLLNDTFTTQEDVRNILGLPVLSVIPREGEEQSSNTAGKKKARS